MIFGETSANIQLRTKYKCNCRFVWVWNLVWSRKEETVILDI
jgi:hypothetical protein